MTADNPAATATADPNAGAAQAADTNPATNATNAEGSEATPQDPAAPNEPQDAEASKASDAAAPDTYEFVMPEGVELDGELANAITPVLKKHGLTQEAVNELTAVYASRIKAINEGAGSAFDAAYQARRESEIATQWQDWEAQTATAKDLGKDVKARVIAAVGDLATPEFKQAMNEQGWGNHPELIRMINRLIDYVPPEKGERAASGGGVQDNSWRARADRLYAKT